LEAKVQDQITSKYPDYLCIHHLFEEQVANNPEAIALVFEDEELSYGELNARANRLAHRLIDLGVGPDQRVAICVQRSPAMVVGLMAILKAGGAYAIAQALMCKDASVEFLGFIDVPAPHKLHYKNQDIKQYFIEHVKSMASEVERHKFDILSQGVGDNELGGLIKKAQDLGGYDLNADSSLETVKWQAIYHFSQIAGAYEPLPLPNNLYHFYAADRESANLPQIDMVGGWREILPDSAISSISIPGRHVSMMADVSNRKHLAEALSRALLQEETVER
jgi:thioesterase domain-containing protein